MYKLWVSIRKHKVLLELPRAWVPTNYTVATDDVETKCREGICHRSQTGGRCLEPEYGQRWAIDDLTAFVFVVICHNRLKIFKYGR